jgi:hypothetical protein
MRKYIIYDNTGKILRWGVCSNNSISHQAGVGEHIKIVSNLTNKFDITHKVEFSGYGQYEGPVTEIVKKAPEEIEAEKPPEPPSISIEKRPVRITNEQWQDVLDRLEKLESEIQPASASLQSTPT